MARPSEERISDQRLIDAINAGDQRAFETLYRRYRDWAVNLAYRFTGDREAALDAMQETFLYVLRQFPGFELRARFTTFLYPVVHHIAIAHLRKKRRQITGDAALEAAATITDPPQSDPTDELAVLMAELPEAQREVLLLRFVDGLSLQEIARAVQIPLGTVKSRLHHGLRTLREDPRTRDFFGM